MSIFYIGAEHCDHETTEDLISLIDEPTPEQGVALLAHAVAVTMGASASVYVRNSEDKLQLKCWLH